jgi:amino acid transporter
MQNRLRAGSLGILAVTFFVVSAAGPLVAMAGGIPVAMLFGNGPGTPGLFVVATIILCIFSIAYTAMAREVQDAGAFYALVRRGLGARAGGATALIALLSYNALQIGLYGVLGTSLNDLLSPLLGREPWWVYAVMALLAVAFLGYRRVDLSAKILGVLVACEYLIVLILDFCIVGHHGNAGLSLRPLTPSLVGSGAPWTGLMLCFSAFLGFEATTIYSEEARAPERTIPVATYLSVIVIGVFYSISTWAVVVGVGIDELLPVLQHLQNPTSLLFDLSDRYVSHTVTQIMRVLFVTSTFAGLLAFHNAIARYLFATGRDGLLPEALGRTHQSFQSPHVGSIVQTVLASVSIVLFALFGADPILTVFTLPSAVATLGIIVLMAIVSGAALRHSLRKTERSSVVSGAAVLSLVILAVIAALAAVNFDVLTGTGSVAIRFLPMVLVAVAIVGWRLAGRTAASV